MTVRGCPLRRRAKREAFSRTSKSLGMGPQRPSSISLRADRDLETICLRCLENKPASRYRAAKGLAARTLRARG